MFVCAHAYLLDVLLSLEYTKSVADLKQSSINLQSSPSKPILSAQKAPKAKKEKTVTPKDKRAKALDYF